MWLTLLVIYCHCVAEIEEAIINPLTAKFLSIHFSPSLYESENKLSVGLRISLAKRKEEKEVPNKFKETIIWNNVMSVALSRIFQSFVTKYVLNWIDFSRIFNTWLSTKSEQERPKYLVSNHVSQKNQPKIL